MTRAATMPVHAPVPVLRMLGWCISVILIAAAVLPLFPRALPAHAPALLEVSGAFEHVSPDVVRTVTAPLLHVDFYEIDLNAVKHAVESLPWISRARVGRSWPGTVRVQVWEHVPYARWGAAALLSDEGVVFVPEDGQLPVSLPQLDGPDGREAEVRRVFDALSAQLAGTPLAPVKLTQGARGDWTAVTADAIELRFGRNSPLDAAAELSGPVRTALFGRLQEVAYVDFHYINGFAVGWRDRRGGDRDPGTDPPKDGGE